MFLVVLVHHVVRERRGTGGGIRTPDTRFRRPVLYPAELRLQKIAHPFYQIILFFSSIILFFSCARSSILLFYSSLFFFLDMKPVLIIRHVDYFRLGWIPELFEDLKIPLLQVSLSKGEELPLIQDISGVVSMGGPMSAYDLEEYPFLQKEMDYMKDLREEQLPFLGICLGAQLFSQSLGARVFPMQEKEIGWIPLEPYPEAQQDTFFRDQKVPDCFQLHYDAFELPEGAVPLFKSEKCVYQAYRYGSHAIALQFHPEAHVEMIHHIRDMYPECVSEMEYEMLLSQAAEKSAQGRTFLKALLTALFLS